MDKNNQFYYRFRYFYAKKYVTYIQNNLNMSNSNNIYLYVLIMVIFIAFVGYQIYFYNVVYKKNLETLKKIKSFENEVKGINDTSYLLSDESVSKLLEDFNNIKNNI